MRTDRTARRRIAALVTAVAALAAAAIGGSGGCSGETFQAPPPDDAAAVEDHTASGSDAAETDDAADAEVGRDVASQPPSAYAAAVMQDAPVGYWRLGEAASATKAIDERGAHDGTVAQGVTFGDPGALAGDVDTAATFGAGKIVVGDVWDFSGLAPMSVEAWLRYPSAFTSPTYAEQYLIDKFESFLRGGWHLYLTSYGKLGFDRAPETDASPIDSLEIAFVPSAKFRHVVATFDGGTCRLFVDGVVVANASCTATVPETTAPLTFGASATLTGSNLAGSRDEVAIYDKALSAARVAEHYRIGIGQ